MPLIERQRLTGRRFRYYRSIVRFCSQEQASLDSFWRLPLEKLRSANAGGFREHRISFVLGERTRRLVDLGVDSLLVLSRLRHRQWVATSEWDGILLTEAYEDLPDVPQPDWRLPDSRRGLSPARVAGSAASVDSWLDPGLVLTWLGDQRPGGSLLQEIEAAYRQAFLEERSLESGEPTSYLAHVILAHALGVAWTQGVSSIHSAAFAERVGLAGSVLIHALLEEAVGAAFENPAVVDTKVIDVRREYLLRTSISPVTFMPAASMREAPHVYGLDQDTVSGLAPLLKDVPLQEGDLESHVQQIADRAVKEGGLADHIVVQASVEEVRRAALELAVLLDPQAEGVAAELGRLAADAQAARERLVNSRRRQELIGALEDLALRNPGVAEQAVSVAEAVSPGLSETAMNPETIGTRVRAAVRAAMVMHYDIQARESVEQVFGQLFDVSTERSDVEAEAGYQQGTVYRIAGDDRPILQEVQQVKEAQLFLDLSELVKRTVQMTGARHEQILSRHLYQPLLALAAGGELEAHSFPGDAITWSGDVARILAVIPKIRQVLRKYQQRLELEAPAEQMREELERIESRVRKAREGLSARRQKVTRLLSDIERGMGESKEDTTGTLRLGATAIAEIRRLQNELYRIEEEEAELDRDAAQATEVISGGAMRAGIFVAHGPSSGLLDVPDAGGGTEQVRLSETLNEAMRGTVRNEAVERRLDLVVRNARQMRGKAEIVFPFRVYIDKIWSVPIPPAIVPEFRFAIEERDVAEAQRLFGELARQATEDFARAAARSGPMGFDLIDATHDIWNAGCALTEQTLLAYREAAASECEFFQRSVRLSDLNNGFHERFAFGRARLKLVFAVDRKTDSPRHVFREVGSLIFRGYRGRQAVGVYELLDSQDPFYQLLMSHHFKWWWQERQSTREAREDERASPTDGQTASS